MSELLTEARAWLADCAWLNMEPEDFEELSDEAVLRAVARYYEGGLEAFAASLPPAEPQALAHTSGPRLRPSALARLAVA